MDTDPNFKITAPTPDQIINTASFVVKGLAIGSKIVKKTLTYATEWSNIEVLFESPSDDHGPAQEALYPVEAVDRFNRWSLTVAVSIFRSSHSLNITARATKTMTTSDSKGDPVGDPAISLEFSSVNVQLDQIAPTVTIIAPAPSAAGQPAIINVPELGLDLPITVQAQDNVAVDSVTVSIDNKATYLSLGRDTLDPALWKSGPGNLIHIPSLPLGTRTLFALARDVFGAPTEVSVDLLIRDTTSPDFHVISPSERAKIPWSPSQTVIAVSGTATDMQSGVKSVTCRLLNKVDIAVGPDVSWVNPAPAVSPGTISWSAVLPVPSPGWYSVECECRDAASNPSNPPTVTTVSNLEVAESFLPIDLNDLLGSRQYLSELLKFFRIHFKRSEGTDIKDVTDITPEDLQRVFHQDLDRFATQVDADTAERPVSQVRLCIEVLRKFLDDGSRSDTVWVEDAVPGQAQRLGTWTWVSQPAQPAPVSGSRAHQSEIVAGAMHQHYFDGAAAASLTVADGERLFAYVYLDPLNLPEQVMLQWNDDNPTWGHRAYWGENKIPWGTDGTTSRYHMGPLPAADRWVRLEVPATVVGLPGTSSAPATVTGMAFTLYGGRATWDRAGRTSRQPQLVGHWPLDEAADGVAADVTESKNHGALMGGAAWAVGQGRPVLSLDGVDDYVQVGAPSQLTMTAVMSISAWICPRGPQDGIIVSKEGEYEVARLPNGSIQWAFGNTDPGWNWVNTGVTVPQDQWTHVVVTYDHGVVTTYINGTRAHVYRGKGLLIGVTPQQRDFRIGGRQVHSQHFHGLVSDVRLYHGALSATEVYALHGVRHLEQEYAQLAYEALLRQLGTSYEELRLANGAAAERRLAVAQRLGIDLNPDWSTCLDLLLLEPGEITEAKLESLFGLLNTSLDPFRALPSSALLDWQLRQLRTMWMVEDHSLVEPIIDPDVIGKVDLARTDATDPAFALWKQRSEAIGQRFGQIRADREGEPTPLAGLQKIARDAFAGVINDPAFPLGLVPCGDCIGKPLFPIEFLTCLDAQQRDGKDIAPVLDALHLDVSALRYLLRIVALADAGTVTDAEWEGVYHILTRVWKGSRRKAWRAEEANLSISPQFFQLYGGEPPRLPCTGAMGGALLAHGAEDPSWSLTTPDGKTGEKVYVTQEQPNVWVPNNDRSHWVAPSTTPSSGAAPGEYVYRTKIDLSGWDLATLQIIARVAVDDKLLDVKMNEMSLGLTAAGYRAFTTLSLSGPLEDGENVVEFLVSNGGSSQNPTGFRAELSFAAPPRQVQLPRWRVTERARREWQATLRARIDQKAGMRRGFDLAVQATEELALPILRDALIRVIAATEGMAPADAADWLSERLLIETRGGGWRLTTRALQAIETMQSLIFALRTQRFTPDHPAVGWALPDHDRGVAFAIFDTQDQFDEEWLWAGNYETWRAAMLVFYYPENILLPSLWEADERTPQFYHLIKALRARSQLTPKRADELAQQYLDGPGDLNTPPGVRKENLVPPVPPEVRLTSARTDKELRELRDMGEKAFLPKFTNDSPKHLKEIFYFVPMALALQLQKSGEYTAALDWFQTVYGYNLPPDERKIYPGLRADLGGEENGTPILQRTEHWFREFLNPHQLAAARAAYGAASGEPRSNPYTRYTLLSLARCFLEYGDAEFTQDTGESLARARSLYLSARRTLAEPDFDQIAPEGKDKQETLLPNPLLAALRNRIDNQLAKLRQGRNIAGMKREVEIPTPPKTIVGLPTIGSGGQLVVPGLRRRMKPTPYRFSVLMERSKQLVNIAQQIEVAYLSALEKRDGENYNLKKAGFDLDLAKAGKALQDLRVTEATDGETLATNQKSRATKQKETYKKWIDNGPSGFERAMIDSYKMAEVAQHVGAHAAAAITIAQAITTAATAGTMNGANVPGAVAGAVAVSAAALAKVGADEVAISAQTQAQISSLQASYERRANDWQLAADLADLDEQIADQQGKLAKDHTLIVEKEQSIALEQSTQAEAMKEYLANKFTSAELYEWMSGILGGVYSYFLQQATGVAMLAEGQLTFERQEAPTSFIQNDYWDAPAEGSTANSGQAKDRRGLTGSARLLQDIYQLDQYAFETNKRKLNLVHTISLAALDPYAFAVFRATGVLGFNTPMRLFDEGFPGHYLRLIKCVRTSVVALIPPSRGIRATLTASGISRVIVGGDVFQETTIRRDPEMVALSSPFNQTGVFELDAQSELLMPFESMGVDTRWELAMPRASNPFDFGTISDVMITIEYTALFSDDYRRQVIQQLDPQVNADISYSICNDFPDIWYDLNNPEAGRDPTPVSFRSERGHFPPNLDEDIKLRELLFVVLPKDDATEVSGEVRLTFAPDGPGAGSVGPRSATLTDRRVHTRLSGGNSAWGVIKGKRAVGTWQFDLSDDLRDQLAAGVIADLLVVTTFSGTRPPWPS